MRVLSGVQSSGKLHLGNYFSMMKRMIHYQEHSDLFCFIADYHAMTTVRNGSDLSANTRDAALDFLALGIDPDRSTFWVQSDVKEVIELAWILSMSITVPQLELAHSYKDKVAQGVIPSAGLFYYPVLMAADILLFGAEKIPVGKDQKQHLEISRDIARRFNNEYGEIFIIPESDILKETATVPGVDGRKMSKSYKNTLNIFSGEKELKKSVMSIVTDSAGLNDEKATDGTPLFEIYKLFLNDEQVLELRDKYKTPGVGYGHIKQDLLKTILNHFEEARNRRLELERIFLL
ncbi:MAG: tryptophan--tRNA ligase, partial [Spirochaetia bacterium]|nr:tryptophan--tRNA ligase [Spirochaetia bacterium]